MPEHAGAGDVGERATRRAEHLDSSCASMGGTALRQHALAGVLAAAAACWAGGCACVGKVSAVLCCDVMSRCTCSLAHTAAAACPRLHCTSAGVRNPCLGPLALWCGAHPSDAGPGPQPHRATGTRHRGALPPRPALSCPAAWCRCRRDARLALTKAGQSPRGVQWLQSSPSSARTRPCRCDSGQAAPACGATAGVARV